jgi:hypothetical protein
MNQSALELMRQLCQVGLRYLYHEIDFFRLNDYALHLSKPSFDALKQYMTQFIKSNDYCSLETYSFCRAANLLVLEMSKESCGKLMGCSEDQLKFLSVKALEIHDSLQSAALKLAEDENCMDLVLLRSKDIDLWFSRPDSVSRPLHVHYTSNEIGGGNLNRILEQLKLYEHENFKVPESWIRQNNENPHRLSVNPYTTLKMIGQGRIEESCFQSMRIAKVMQAVSLEAAELHLEMTMWRRIPCAMALHSRLGKESYLGWLGQDIIQMVLKF